MQVEILFNSSSKNKSLSAGWGLSLLIDHRLIFDAGEKEEYLQNNLNKLQVDLSLVESVVISHDHWDHTGGLWAILRTKRGLTVYGCPGFSADFKHNISKFPAKLVEVSHVTQIAPDIYSTGEILGTYNGKTISEQALVIKTEKGFSVLTGCAHPGIIKILKKIKASLNIEEFYAVLGGFHLKDQSMEGIHQIVDEFIALKVRKVGATHCSGTNAENIFQDVYKGSFWSMHVGETISI